MRGFLKRFLVKTLIAILFFLIGLYGDLFWEQHTKEKNAFVFLEEKEENPYYKDYSGYMKHFVKKNNDLIPVCAFYKLRNKGLFLANEECLNLSSLNYLMVGDKFLAKDKENVVYDNEK